MRIYIPSLDRAETHRTLATLPPTADAWLVVSKRQQRAYGPRTIVCPRQGNGTIGEVRQWIVENHDVRELGPSIFMFDDDLRFHQRLRDDPTKFSQMTMRQKLIMLSRVAHLAGQYAHGGIAGRDGANRYTDKIRYNERILRAHFYNVRTLRKHNIRFDRLPVMEDFDVSLQLLELGYDNAKWNLNTQDHKGSNEPGGCSTYRTAAIQARGARGLVKLHPMFVKVVEKDPLTSKGWDGENRLDVNIRWKDARDYADKKRNVG